MNRHSFTASMIVLGASLAGTLTASAALAHTATTTPPARSAHTSGAHGSALSYARISHYFRHLFGLHEDPRPGEVEVVFVTQPNGQVYTMLSDGEMMHPYQPVSVPSDAERYRTATGLSLPAKHSLLTLPPATPRGDYTYIWANSSTD